MFRAAAVNFGEAEVVRQSAITSDPEAQYVFLSESLRASKAPGLFLPNNVLNKSFL